MTLLEQKRTLVSYLNMKVLQEDWHGVSDAANDLREIEVALRHYSIKPSSIIPQESLETRTEAAAPPVPMEIIHHANEVASLLKLSDEDLVDRMFPDHTTEVEA